MILERYRDDAHRTLEVARMEARKLRHNYIGTEHLLLALTTEDFGAASTALTECGVTKEGLLSQVDKEVPVEEDLLTSRDAEALAALGIDLDEVRRRIDETFGPFALETPPPCDKGIHLTDKSKHTLKVTVQQARLLGHRRVGPEHLLLALTEDERTLAVRLIKRLGAKPRLLRERILTSMHETD